MRKLPRIVVIFSVLLFWGCPGGPSPVPGDTRPAQFHLVILHTNDFHGEDYAALARECALIRKIRNGEKSALYLDAGDVFTRGKYHEVFYGELEFAVLNAIGCRALTLGNNEFKATAFAESAQKYLFERIDQAEFPVLCANVKLAGNGAYLPNVKPYVVLESGGVKVGIIGISADRIKEYEQAKGFIVEDAVTTAVALAPRVAAEADVVLALTHVGFDADCRLAEAATDIRAIIGGDSHKALRKPFEVKGIPIVQAGDGGQYLGRLDLHFELRYGKYELMAYRGILIPITDELPEDPAIRSLIESYLKKVEKEAA